MESPANVPLLLFMIINCIPAKNLALLLIRLEWLFLPIILRINFLAVHFFLVLPLFFSEFHFC